MVLGHQLGRGVVEGPVVGERLGVGNGHRAQRPQALGMLRRQHPGHNGSPVVTHQVDLLGSELVAEVEDVTDEVVDGVRLYRGGTGPGGVAALVGGDAPVAGGSERAELCPPLAGRLGEAVQQHDRPPLVRAARQSAKYPIPDGDLDLLHGGEATRPGIRRACRRRALPLRVVPPDG